MKLRKDPVCRNICPRFRPELPETVSGFRPHVLRRYFDQTSADHVCAGLYGPFQGFFQEARMEHVVAVQKDKEFALRKIDAPVSCGRNALIRLAVNFYSFITLCDLPAESRRIVL